ncbi:hypothetical protein [Marinoscillum sp.]|uniref:hypothetical protein n=1 Tax=Marinoscillum sp. TaxID=2024838 RepID=UPI003BAC1D34
MNLTISNLNNSVVFYRNLFNRMPDSISFNAARFTWEGEELILTENEKQPLVKSCLIVEVSSGEHLREMYARIKRYISQYAWHSQCKILDEQFAVSDPDGHQWIIRQGNVDINSSIVDYCFLEQTTK